jgi:hypothetical protein
MLKKLIVGAVVASISMGALAQVNKPREVLDLARETGDTQTRYPRRDKSCRDSNCGDCCKIKQYWEC